MQTIIYNCDYCGKQLEQYRLPVTVADLAVCGIRVLVDREYCSGKCCIAEIMRRIPGGVDYVEITECSKLLP